MLLEIVLIIGLIIVFGIIIYAYLANKALNKGTSLFKELWEK